MSEATKPLTAQEVRKARARRLGIRVLLWVVVPTILATIYYGFWATRQYESVAEFTVQANDSIGVGSGPLAALLPTSNLARDASLVNHYIRSRTMLSRLATEHGLIEHYQNPDADRWSRLDSDASNEETYEYYLDKVKVSGSGGGVMILRVRAYSAEAAQEYSLALLEYAEEMVNQLSERGRRDRISFAEAEVANSQERLRAARATLLALQGEGEELNPAASAMAIMTIKTQLEAELAKATAELDSLRAAMRSDAPKVVVARQRVRSLQRQISKQANRLVNGKADSINNSIARFEPALLEKEFAERLFETALKSLELARIEAVREHRYLVTIAPPSLPDRPSYPKRVWGIATVFVLGLVLMGVVTLLVAAIREHARL